ISKSASMTPRHAPRASEFGVMTQFAVRIGSILLICVAVTPVLAGPRGGAPFLGGGVHFGGGGGAPHFSRPQFLCAPPVHHPSWAAAFRSTGPPAPVTHHSRPTGLRAVGISATDS